VNLEDLTLAMFEPLVGETFALDAGADEPLVLVLAAAAPAGEQPRGRAPFSLLFHGPPQPLLAQATYRLEHTALGTLEIFIVPLGQDAQATRYEAIFA
jgi:hypothetical protein